ncbi:SlyX family protein [Thiopseudomonas acetoxidans]|uniref:Protein SlyX homolog n=1 Tax=Thiopseudomonas acetoxidans TaxID=3041622 RepID=A0ABT7SQT4_9GAMM|nr:SlyX family protein [Thiopseudomonas sp. CY1220]MDM7858558.1 SlyX family protein [Thiopseudomonas sp. CY1220]
MSALESRLADLEIHQAFQDDTVQTLSDIIADQQQQIDKLKRQLELLDQRLQEQQSDLTEVPSDPPPHY